jgi:PhnB protein
LKLNPYLNYNGDCAGALKFYEEVLGAKKTFSMTWGEMPGAEAFPAETHNLIMHASLNIGDSVVMCADSPPGQYKRPTGMNVSIHVKDVAEGQELFNKLAEGGEVQMPFQKTFWAPGFGMCVDRFGIPWMVNCEGEGQTA